MRWSGVCLFFILFSGGIMCLLPTVNCSSDSRCFTSSTDYQEHHALWWLEPVTGAHVVKGTNLKTSGCLLLTREVCGAEQAKQ